MRLAPWLMWSFLAMACGSRSSLLDGELPSDARGVGGSAGSGGSGAGAGSGVGGGNLGSGGSTVQPACENWGVTKTWSLPDALDASITHPRLTPLSPEHTSFALTLVHDVNAPAARKLWHFRIDPWQASSGGSETLTGHALEGLHPAHIGKHAVGLSGTPGAYALAVDGQLNGVDLRHSVQPETSSPGPSTWLSAQYFGSPLFLDHHVNSVSELDEYVVGQDGANGTMHVRAFVPETSSVVDLGFVTCGASGSATAVSSAAGLFVIATSPQPFGECSESVPPSAGPLRLQVSRYDGAELELVFEQTEPDDSEVASVVPTDKGLWIVTSVDASPAPSFFAQRVGFDGSLLTPRFQVSSKGWNAASARMGDALAALTFEPDPLTPGLEGVLVRVFDQSGSLTRQFWAAGHGPFLAAAGHPDGSALLVVNSDGDEITIRRFGCVTD